MDKINLDILKTFDREQKKRKAPGAVCSTWNTALGALPYRAGQASVVGAAFGAKAFWRTVGGMMPRK